MEQFGFGKMEPGVNLYCNKVLIQQNSDVILPDWLRFVRGVIDSEDLPLNISRETFQDNALVQKLKKIITTRFLKFLEEKMKENREEYNKFWKTLGMFLKQGSLDDFEHRENIAPLLLFESSKTNDGECISLSEYIERMKPGQDCIYYLSGNSRGSIQSGPYMETFLKKDIETLYLYDAVDDFVLSGLREFEGKKLVSADQSELDLPDIEDDTKESEDEKTKLTRDDTDDLCGWIKEILGDRVDAVRDSKRLVDSPAMIVCADSHLTASMQRLMQSANRDFAAVGKNSLEINPTHPILIQLSNLKKAGQNEAFQKGGCRAYLRERVGGCGLAWRSPRHGET